MANLHDLAQVHDRKRRIRPAYYHGNSAVDPRRRQDKADPRIGTPFGATQTKDLCYSILTDAQKHKFEENNELDLSFGVKNLSRFRANIFVQRGAVAAAIRTIPVQDQDIPGTGTAGDRVRPLQEAARTRSGHRAHGKRQIDDTGLDDRQDQHANGRNISSPSKIRSSISILIKNAW